MIGPARGVQSGVQIESNREQLRATQRCSTPANPTQGNWIARAGGRAVVVVDLASTVLGKALRVGLGRSPRLTLQLLPTRRTERDRAGLRASRRPRWSEPAIVR